MNEGLFAIDFSITDRFVIFAGPGYAPKGKAFIYDAANSELITSMDPDPSTPDCNFGWQVNHNSNYLVISSMGDTSAGIEGSVYVYEPETRALLYRFTSPVPDTAGVGQFGFKTELEGDTLLVGSGNNAPIGIRSKVAVYDLSTGSLVTLLDGDPSSDQEGFGASFSIQDNIAVIGAPASDLAGTDKGAVYIFDMNTLTVTDTVFLPSSATDQLLLGSRVKIQDDTILATSAILGDPFGSLRVHVLRQFCRPDINLDGSIDFFDISIFVMEMIDWDMNGVFDFFDVSKFLQAFDEGCP